MKKLMIVAAVAMAALASQASYFKWSAANIYDGGGESAKKLTSGTAYLFTTSAYTQDALFNAIAEDSSFDYAAASIGSLSVNSSGGITAASTEWKDATVGKNYDMYFAIVEDDKIYFSNIKTGIGANSGDTPATVAFGTQAPTSGNTSKSLPTDGYVGAGQWASVPEPTSGLLLLLGVAGLALRRRRA